MQFVACLFFGYSLLPISFRCAMNGNVENLIPRILMSRLSPLSDSWILRYRSNLAISKSNTGKILKSFLNSELKLEFFNIAVVINKIIDYFFMSEVISKVFKIAMSRYIIYS